MSPHACRIARRALLAGLGTGFAATLAQPLRAQGITPMTRLRRLQPGDRVGLVAPAGFIDDASELALIEDTVRAMELEPVSAPNILSRNGYLAGTDEERASSLNTMFAEHSIKAIFAVRGGWGCARILPLLDYDAIKANPKIFAGFSDITALHCAFAAKDLGFPTFHSPNASAAWPTSAWSAFRAQLFEGDLPDYQPVEGRADRLVQREGRIDTISSGRVSGRLLGGNLTVFSALVGTPYFPDLDGAILFLEDIGEAPYRIDRMLTQLRLTGALNGLSGIMFGRCTACESDSGSLGGFTLFEVLADHFSALGIPAFVGAPIGHFAGQVTIPYNARCTIDASSGRIWFDKPAIQ